VIQNNPAFSFSLQARAVSVTPSGGVFRLDRRPVWVDDLVDEIEAEEELLVWGSTVGTA
jgi:hypothetical protein